VGGDLLTTTDNRVDAYPVGILFFSYFFFVIAQNMIICTVAVHYSYLTKFTGCDKINILKDLLTQFTRL